jgi:hypothetical protein
VRYLHALDGLAGGLELCAGGNGAGQVSAFVGGARRLLGSERAQWSKQQDRKQILFHFSVVLSVVMDVNSLPRRSKGQNRILVLLISMTTHCYKIIIE